MKKKGFTLIELLAVIVILAILALIAIPIVISIINDSRENSHKRSIESYGRNVENAITSYIEKNDVNEIPKTLSSYSIKMSGSKVKCDDDFQYDDEELILTHCRVVDSKGKQKSKHTYTYKNRELINEDEEGYQTFSIGQEVTLNDEKYNVIGIGSDYVVALKADPLTIEEVNENKIGSDGLNHVNRYTIYNVGEVNTEFGDARLAYYSNYNCKDIDFWNRDESGCTNSYDRSDIKYVIDMWASNEFSENQLKMVNGYKARIISKEDLIQFYPNCDFDGRWCDPENTTPNWIYGSTYWYWTMSQWNRNQNNVWGVHGSGYLYDAHVSYGDYGVLRPVINVYKSAL